MAQKKQKFESVNKEIIFQKQTFELSKPLCFKQKNAPSGILLTMVGAAGCLDTQ